MIGRIAGHEQKRNAYTAAVAPGVDDIAWFWPESLDGLAAAHNAALRPQKRPAPAPPPPPRK